MNIEEVFRRYIKKKKQIDNQLMKTIKEPINISISNSEEIDNFSDEDKKDIEWEDKEFAFKEDCVINSLKFFLKVIKCSQFRRTALTWSKIKISLRGFLA